MASRIPQQKTTTLTVLCVAGAVVAAGIVALLVIARKEYRSIELMRNQILSLQSDVGLITVSNDIFSTRADRIRVIENAFPDEQSIPDFIQDLQTVLAAHSDSSTYKLVTKVPMTEAGRLVLVWSVTTKSDTAKFTGLLTAIERMPYLIHVGSIVGRMPDGPQKQGEYQIVLKVYVKNQFSN